MLEALLRGLCLEEAQIVGPNEETMLEANLLTLLELLEV